MSILLKLNIAFEELMKGFVALDFEIAYTLPYKKRNLFSRSPGRKKAVFNNRP